MQIFTLGKNGITLFLFAFILLIGSLPSYGQEPCPTEGDITSDTFCYLQTVSDLTNDEYPVYQTDDNENDTQPIPADELLTDGETYFVGGTSGDCDRIAVTVTVEVVERPTNTIFPNSSSFEITPCSSTAFTADDLASYFDATLTNYEVEVYTTQFGTTEAQGELVAGQSYFVGQVSTDPADCPSLRAAVGYNPINPDPPIADSPQIFCEGATVADLQAEGTYDNTQAIRWYRSIDANSPLADDTQLINGQTYYATQIVNDRNDPFPPCESDERTAVQVEVQDLDAGEQIGDGIYCQSEIDNRLENTPPDQLVRELFTEQLEPGVPTDGTFADLSINEVMSQYQNGVRSFSTTYTISNDLGCEDSVDISISIEEDFNAGQNNTDNVICRSELPETLSEQEVRNFFLNLLSEDADTNGTFSEQSIAEITDTFNSGDGTGIFSTTYTVGEGTACEDTADLAVTVEGANAGEDNTSTVLCRSELPATVDEATVRNFFEGLIDPTADTGGTFSSNTIAEITEEFNSGDGTGTFSTVYTVGEGTACQDTALLSVTVQDPNAGDDNTTATFCRSELPETFTEDEARDFFLNLLSEDADTDGTFSEESIAEITEAFNSGDGTGTFSTTYTVGEGTACPDTAQLAVTVNESGNAGDDADLVLCQAEAEALVNEYLADPNQDPDVFFAEWIGNRDTDGTFSGDPLASIITQYNADSWPIEVSTIYTVDEGTECEDSAEISLTIYEGGLLNESYSDEVCNAGLDESIDDIEQVRSLFLNMLDSEVPRDGTFSPSLSNIISQYEDDNIGDFVTTYTVGEGECQDSAVLTLTVVEPIEADAGEINGFEICPSDDTLNLFTYLNIDSETGEFSDDSGVIAGGNLNISSTGTRTITYTVNDQNAFCVVGSDFTNFEVEVLPGANAGENATVNLDEDDTEPVDLFDALGGTPDEGGTWSPGNGVFDPATDSAGSFTYTVTNGDCEDSAIVTVTITEPTDPGDGNCPEVTNPDQSFCPGSATVADLFPTDAVWYETADATEALSSDTLLEDGEDYFAGNAEGTCESRSAVTVSLDGQIAGSDNTGEVCNTGLDESIDDIEQVRALFLNLLDPGVARDGTFAPSMQQIINQYESNPIGSFTTTYTVTEGDCEDSAELTLTVIEPTEANAGEDVSLTFCSTDDDQDLFNFLGESANTGGTFEGLTNGIFSPSERGAGIFTITYTVDDTGFCVLEGSEDFSTFTIEVLQGPNAGPDVNLEYCITEIEEMTEAELLAIFDSLISEDADQDGTFSPDLDTLMADFMANPIGTFETTYTVVNGQCEDSAEISITVNDTVEADAGEDTSITFCATTEEENLFDYLATGANPNGTFEGYEDGIFSPTEEGVGVYTITYTVDSTTACVTGDDTATYTVEVVADVDAGSDNSLEICQAEIDEMLPNVENVRDLYLSLLDEGVSREGTFNPSIQALADRYNSEDQLGDFSTTYTVAIGECEDSVELTVTVLEGEAPNAGEDMDLVFCTTEGAQDLFEYLADDVNTTGSFEGLEDGIFDPAAFDPGTYTYEYTVTTEGECGGTDSATFSITVGDVPDAPEVTDAVFCVSEGATVADLDAGENLNWYTDEDLNEPVSPDDVLVGGAYYATQTNEAGCESPATTITVTLDDTAAPTLSPGGNVFCDIDNPTIADLEDNIVESGMITWYDAATGGETYNSADLLEDGTTYYASLTNGASTCESSQRLAVTVTIEVCEIIIPEAFSPNGDGINDVFEVENLAGEYPNYNMQIFNRWGNKVFTGNSSNPEWDGTSDEGSLGDGVLPVGVYFYIIDFNDGQTAPIQGRVYLSR